MPDWNEYSEVERPALDFLDDLGWEIHDAEEDLLPDNRSNFQQVILEERLREALQRINPWIDENNLGRAVREIRAIDAVDGMHANEQVHENLVKHIALEQDLGEGKKHQTVKYIDYEHPENNDFTAFSQYEVAGPTETIKPDIVAFVNGIPLGVIECKSPSLTDPLHRALEQMTRYQNQRGGDREGAERLFWYNQFSVVTWYENALAGTYGTPRSEYKEWKDPYPATDDQLREQFGLGTAKVTPQHRLLYALFEPERLLDLLRHFTVFEERGNETRKLVARYQQYRAVQKALERIEKRDQSETNGGVVWHTQGSGKSLTMLFLGLKLRRLKPNPTLLLVTDRQALDRQIKKTFERCGFPNPKRARSIDDLRVRLSHGAGETITTLIQKFQFEDEEGSVPVVSESEDIYVMADEAHRTQDKSLANNMRTALPNAFYVGFTGTPIEKERRNTRKTFGNYIDQYTIDRSIEDGTTVPILYQGRLADIHLDGADLDAIFERVFSDRTAEERAEIQKRYAREQDLAEAPKRIQTVCVDILEHYEEAIAEPFKGLIVTTSRQAAITYKDQLDTLNGPESAVVISGDHNDPQKFKEHTPSDNQREVLKDRFNDPNDDLEFLIVCEMLLTGFDAPIAQVMYLDKPLKEHSLLQAIARVNRPYEDKNYGLIVDYYGVSENLHEALYMFSERDVERAMTPLEDERPKLEAAHRRAVSFFQEVDRDDIEACLQVLEDEERRIQFNRAFKQFSKMMEIVLPDPMANPYKADLKRLSDIYAWAKNRYRDDSMNLDGCGEKVKQLIREHIAASGIDILNPEPVSILDEEEFEEAVDGLDSDEARASEMQHALTHEIRVRYDEDPVYYQSLQERVEELIEQYKEKRLDEKDLISEYRDIIGEIRSREDQAEALGLNGTTELSFYHALEDVFDGEEVGSDALVDITGDIAEIIEAKRVVDWKSKVTVQKEMRREIKLYLIDRELDIEFDQLDAITTRIISLARVNFQ